MCCLFCTSFRGAAYFVTTFQILIGLGISIKYALAFPNIFHVTLADLQDLEHGTKALLLVYGILIILLGCCSFRAIEHQSLRGLKVTVGGLTMMQIFVLLTHLVLIARSFDDLTEPERMDQVSVLAGNLVVTFLLLTTLFLYMIRLAKRDLVLMRSSSSESSLPLSSTGGLLTTTKAGVIGDPHPHLHHHHTLHHSTHHLHSGGVGGAGSGGTSSSNSNNSNGRYSVGSSTLTSSSLGQRYIDGQWEDLHV